MAANKEQGLGFPLLCLGAAIGAGLVHAVTQGEGAASTDVARPANLLC